MKCILSLFLTLLLCLLTAACGSIPASSVVGSGEITSQTFDVGHFDRVSLDGFGNVFISQGETENVEVQTDENILPFLEIRVQGSELRLGIQRGIDVNPTRSITFNVTVQDLSRVAVNGSGDIYVEPIQTSRFAVALQGSGNIEIKGLAAEGLSIDLNGSGNIDIQGLDIRTIDTSLQGSGDIKLAGVVGTQNVRVNGSGNYRAADLEAAIADISIPGSADLTVWVSDEMTVRVNGSGNIEYYGRPQIDQSGSGSGELISLGEK